MLFQPILLYILSFKLRVIYKVICFFYTHLVWKTFFEIISSFAEISQADNCNFFAYWKMFFKNVLWGQNRKFGDFERNMRGEKRNLFIYFLFVKSTGLCQVSNQTLLVGPCKVVFFFFHYSITQNTNFEWNYFNEFCLL
jgi:hypothetical protein